jgi:hypothetical protein
MDLPVKGASLASSGASSNIATQMQSVPDEEACAPMAFVGSLLLAAEVVAVVAFLEQVNLRKEADAGRKDSVEG